MNFVRITIPFILIISSLGCATNSQTRWALMGAAAPVGAGLGAATSPDEIKAEYHAFYWSAAFVAAAAIIGNYFYSDKKEIDKLKSENDKLKNTPKFELIKEGVGEFNSPFDKSGKSNIKWKIYKTDKWLSDGPNTKYHQDLKLEKIPNDNEEK